MVRHSTERLLWSSHPPDEAGVSSKWAISLLLLHLVGCATVDVDEPRQRVSRVVRIDRSDAPGPGLTDDELARFRAGDELFEAVFREPDGLGPLYIRASCSDCHKEDGRGPGRVVRFGEDRSRSFELGERPSLSFGATARPFFTKQARTGIDAPDVEGWTLTFRLPPAVFGRGLIEDVDERELERLAAERRDGVRGRLARVRSASGAVRIGRFGLKATVPDLREFSARALRDDMGLTNPLYPVEAPNPDGLVDDEKEGIDLSFEQVDALADYVRFLASPVRRSGSTDVNDTFVRVGCSGCHVPSLRLRPGSPTTRDGTQEAVLYSDLLLHDMGEGLADGVSEGDAGPRDWRTAPLLGLRFFPGYLHDGRAANVEAAILEHAGEGSEANQAVSAFSALATEERRRLLEFVEGL